MLLLASLALAEPYVLAEAGITFNLPAGWEMTRWSDWDFTAKHQAGLAMEQWYTGWQLPVDVAAGKSFASLYAERLEDQRAGNLVTTSVTAEKAGRIDFVHTQVDFNFDNGKGPKGVAHFAAIGGEGKVLHLVIYAAGPNGPRAAAQLVQIIERLSLDKPPADVASLGGAQPSTLGFTVNLPAGWRVPLPAEKAEVSTLAGTTGATKADACFAAARPDPAGTALLLLCGGTWTLGIVDADSFPDKAPLVTAGLFGKAATKLAAPTPLTTPDRTGFLFRPEINDHDLRAAVVPYDKGAIYGWIVGPTGSGAELESVLGSTLQGLTYDGPNNGLAEFPFGERMMHTIQYNPIPSGLCCFGAFAPFLAGIGFLVFRKKPAQPSYMG